MYIKPYDNKDATFKVKDRADRILLMHKTQITKLFSKVKEKGLTLIPTKIYFEGSLVKVEVALCQGKHNYDKKQVLKEKDIAKDTLRQLKRI
jgi:SsrA-binding protein